MGKDRNQLLISLETSLAKPDDYRGMYALWLAGIINPIDPDRSLPKFKFSNLPDSDISNEDMVTIQKQRVRDFMEKFVDIG